MRPVADVLAGKRISVLLPDLRPGGAEKLHVHLAREWRRRGIEVEFILRQAHGELLNALPEGVSVADLGARRVRNLIRPLASYLRRVRPDVLLAAMWPTTTLAPYAARLAGFRGRVVISEHTPLSLAYIDRGWLHRRFLRLSQRLGYPRVNARIAVSGGVADDLSKLSGLSRDQFIVLHNPAALGVAAESPVEPAALARLVRPFILSVGTLKPVKRQDLLIRAFASMAPSTRGTLILLGEGPLRDDLESLVSALGLKGNVLLPGHVADPGTWYAHADLFVLSSDYEGFGNVLVEAMEYGLPIVSTDCVAGPAEVLANGRFGRLVPTGDVSALASAMGVALSTPVDREALKARASEFAVGAVADKYLDVLFPGWRKVSGQ